MKLFQTKYGVFTSFNNDNEMNSILNNNEIPNFDILEILKPYISEAHLIIDIGSSIGIRPVYYSKINPSIGIYCFEPRDNLFCLLTKNLTENNILNTVLLNNMLGHVCGTIRLPLFDKVICDHNDIIQLGNGSIIGYENEPIHFVTLDSLKLLSCDIIFIDLRGFDYLVLLGGLNTIKKFKPIICIKYSKKYNEDIFLKLGIFNDGENMTIDFLTKIEYSIKEINDQFILAIPIIKQVQFNPIKINPIKINSQFIPVIPQNVVTTDTNIITDDKNVVTTDKNVVINDIDLQLPDNNNSDNEIFDYKHSLKSEEIERLINLGYQFISDV